MTNILKCLWLRCWHLSIFLVLWSFYTHPALLDFVSPRCHVSSFELFFSTTNCQLHIYILKLKYDKYTKMSMIEVLTSVHFLGFIIILRPSSFAWFCATSLPCVFLWTFFFCCQLHISFWNWWISTSV